MKNAHPSVLSFSGNWSLVLLAAAHLLILISLNSFAQVNAGSPLDLLGVVTYAILVLGSLLAIPVYLRPLAIGGAARLFVYALPVFASFAFWIGLRGLYAPYDPFDSDMVRAGFIAFAVLFAAVALLWRSLPFLWTAAGIQAAAYFSIYLPQFLTYPGASLLGVRPGVFVALTTIYAVAAVLLWRMNRPISRQWEPLFALGKDLLSIAGCVFTFLLLQWLPESGAVLAYQNGSPVVVGGVWVYMQTLAAILCLASALLAIVDILSLLRLRANVLATTY